MLGRPSPDAVPLKPSARGSRLLSPEGFDAANLARGVRPFPTEPAYFNAGRGRAERPALRLSSGKLTPSSPAVPLVSLSRPRPPSWGTVRCSGCEGATSAAAADAAVAAPRFAAGAGVPPFLGKRSSRSLGRHPADRSFAPEPAAASPAYPGDQWSELSDARPDGRLGNDGRLSGSVALDSCAVAQLWAGQAAPLSPGLCSSGC